MSHNRKVLKTATKELGKAKVPAKPKDIVTDPMGQWKYPGENTRIPGSDITMQGVDYPVWAQPNIGQPQMMYPGQEYQFPGADYVDEFPQGGNEEYYEDDLDEEQIAELRAGGYIVDDISVPELTKAQKGITISDPKEYAYRKAAYDDSLKLYNYDSKPIHELNLNSINFIKQNKNKPFTSSLKNKLQKEALNTLSKYKYPDLKSSVKNVPKEKTTIYDIEVNAKGNPYLSKNFTLTHKKPVQKINKGLNTIDVIEREPLPEIGRLPIKHTEVSLEIVPQTFNYIPKKQEPIQVANRSQTVMEPDPDREGKYIMKEIRQVPYFAKFPGEAKWEPANAPRVMYVDAEGNETEERPGLSKQKQGGALLTKKVTCKNCGWTWNAADGGNDMTTCHKCGGEGLVHAKKGGSLKKYSRSIEATNKLFHVSPLLKKAKSRKKKIFDPSSNYFQNGGQEGPRNQNIDTVDTDAMNAMMKARMATLAELGNPSAQRMVSPNPKTYDFGNGNFGTHYMSSIDNYAVPLLQDKGGNELEYNENPEPSNEDMRFETPEEANYFAEHYKEVAPMMNNFNVGGIPNLPLREGRKAYERLGYTDNDRMVVAAKGGFLPKAQFGANVDENGKPISYSEANSSFKEYVFNPNPYYVKDIGQATGLIEEADGGSIEMDVDDDMIQYLLSQGYDVEDID